MNAMGFLAVSAALCLGVSAAHADVVTEWNLKTAQFTLDARIPPPDANQVVATTSVSVSDALTAISGKFPPLLVKLSPSPGASVDATVAAASHGVLLQMTTPASRAESPVLTNSRVHARGGSCPHLRRRPLPEFNRDWHRDGRRDR
jgi:hypothetical protein